MCTFVIDCYTIIYTHSTQYSPAHFDGVINFSLTHIMHSATDSLPIKVVQVICLLERQYHLLGDDDKAVPERLLSCNKQKIVAQLTPVNFAVWTAAEPFMCPTFISFLIYM